MTRTARIAQLRESIARRALNTIDTPATASILAIVRTGDILHIATAQPDEYLPYAVDSFRFPTPDLDDPDYLDEADAPKRWTLIYQHGGAGPDEIDRMLTAAKSHAPA